MDLSFKNKMQSYLGFDFCSMLETNKPVGLGGRYRKKTIKKQFPQSDKQKAFNYYSNSNCILKHLSQPLKNHRQLNNIKNSNKLSSSNFLKLESFFSKYFRINLRDFLMRCNVPDLPLMIDNDNFQCKKTKTTGRCSRKYTVIIIRAHQY